LKALIRPTLPRRYIKASSRNRTQPRPIATLRAKYHLDLPWYQQFVLYVGDLAHGDLGESIRLRKPVIDEIGYRYVNTICSPARRSRSR